MTSQKQDLGCQSASHAATDHSARPHGCRGTLMRKHGLLIGAVAAAGALVVGSALTASSTIYDPAVHVGSVAQSVSGVTINDVNYSYTPATDTTTAIDVVAEE